MAKKVEETKKSTEKEVKKPKEKEVKETKKETEEEEFFDKKTSKDLKEKSTFSRVMNIVLWIVLFAWMAVCLVDFYNVHQENEPKFCLSKTTTEYSDGTVDTCTGLGYKVFHYKRDSFKAIEFGPIWGKDRTADNK